MKTLIYISGLLGIILLVISSIGIFAELPYNTLIFVISLALLILIFTPLMIMDKHHQNKKIDNIIESYKGQNKKEKTIKHSQLSAKGWGMNNSPFRERKSGLNWGGGNIKGANAARGSRKSFLK